MNRRLLLHQVADDVADGLDLDQCAVDGVHEPCVVGVLRAEDEQVDDATADLVACIRIDVWRKLAIQPGNEVAPCDV